MLFFFPLIWPFPPSSLQSCHPKPQLEFLTCCPLSKCACKQHTCDILKWPCNPLLKDIQWLPNAFKIKLILSRFWKHWRFFLCSYMAFKLLSFSLPALICLDSSSLKAFAHVLPGSTKSFHLILTWLLLTQRSTLVCPPQGHMPWSL